MSTALTAEDLTQLLAVLNGGTPGEPVIYQSGTQTRAEMLAYFGRTTIAHKSTNLYAVGIQGATSDGLPQIIALTGNSPDAEANAQKLAVAAYTAPRLVGVIAELMTGIGAALDALAAGDAVAAQARLRAALEGTA